jgi:hypothetical protein
VTVANAMKKSGPEFDCKGNGGVLPRKLHLERDTPLEVVHILTLMANGWTSVSEIKGR